MSRTISTAPTGIGERVHELDILRGFALLGILMSNIAYFASPAIFLPQTNLEWWTNPWDKGTKLTLEFLSSFKFLTMFSFLFGLGFVIFLRRAELKGGVPYQLFLKRLSILLIFGLIHLFLIWSGDILSTYAVIAPLLLLFYRKKPRTILIWALALLLLPASLMFLGALGVYLNGATELPDAVGTVYSEKMVEQSVAAYGAGTFTDMVNQRAADFLYMLNGYTVMVPIILGMFLLGVYAAKTELYRSLSTKLPFVRKTCVVSLIIGLPFNILYAYSSSMSSGTSSLFSMMSAGAGIVGGPAMCIFYMTLVVMLCQNKAWRRGLSLLQAVGRMSLTNYLLQSVICTFIFYNYGLGWYGKVGPMAWLSIVAVVYALQIAVSNLWTRKFRYGPAEWLWRSLTYGRRQPFVERRSLAEPSVN